VALRPARRSGRRLLDLTASNPTTVGLRYERAWHSARRCSIRGRWSTKPACKGILAAPRSRGGYYAAHGVAVTPSASFSTVSTSEAYSYCFRLLCDPEDERAGAFAQLPAVC